MFFFPDEGKTHFPVEDSPPRPVAPHTPIPVPSPGPVYPDMLTPSPLSEMSESLDSSGALTEPDDVDQCYDDEEFCIIDDPGLGIAVRIRSVTS